MHVGIETCLVWLNLISFVRVLHPRLAAFVGALTQTFADLRFFLIIMFLFLGMFGNAYVVLLAMPVDDDEHVHIGRHLEGQHHGGASETELMESGTLSSGYVVPDLFTLWRIMLGDFDPSWLEGSDVGPYPYLFFFLYTVIVVVGTHTRACALCQSVHASAPVSEPLPVAVRIPHRATAAAERHRLSAHCACLPRASVLLNILIAVVSDSYDHAMMEASHLFLRSRIDRAAELAASGIKATADDETTPLVDRLAKCILVPVLSPLLTVAHVRADEEAGQEESWPGRALQQEKRTRAIVEGQGTLLSQQNENTMTALSTMEKKFDDKIEEKIAKVEGKIDHVQDAVLNMSKMNAEISAKLEQLLGSCTTFSVVASDVRLQGSA